jgi:hypothetical protein
LSASKTLNWLCDNRIIIDELLVTKQPDQAPDDSWWIVLFMTREVASRSAITFKVLQGKKLLLQQQREALMKFIDGLCSHFGIEVLEGQPAPLPAGSTIVRSVTENFEVNTAAIRNTWMDMGQFITNKVDGLKEDQKSAIAVDFAEKILKLCEDVEAISPERDSDNNAVQQELPGVLPNEIVNKRPQIINALIQTHYNRLRTKYTAVEIAAMEDEFILLKQMYRDEEAVTEAIDAIEGDGKVWEFERCWESVAARVPLLYDFFGGLGTVFPGTATVEADFSNLKWTKDAYSTSLSDFSLEAKLHTRQFHLIQSL